MATFQIYRNLNKPNHCSIRQNGLVKEWSKEVIAFNCDFHIGESGRLRVIKNRRKNVHAWLKVKRYENRDNINVDGMEELYYDPYITQHWYSLKTGDKITHASVAVFKNNRIYAGSVS